MADWKLAGFVPDSDNEEGWSSEEDMPGTGSPQLEQQEHQPQPAAQSDHSTHNVREFCGSSSTRHGTQPPPVSTTRPLLGSTNADQDSSQLKRASLCDEADDAAAARGLGRDRDSLDLSAECFIRGSPVEQLSPNKLQNAVPLSPTLLEKAQGRLAAGGADDEVSLDTTRSLTPRNDEPDFPTRGRRSLRPRKPIQVNPYLLENARYSRTMKTHGVRPIRIPMEEYTVSRPGRDQELRDTEYAAEDCQNASSVPDEEPDRHRNRREVCGDDEDEFVLPPSPRTSLPQLYLAASSEQSHRHANYTSVDDEELPDAQDLGGSTKIISHMAKRPTPSRSSLPKKRFKMEHTSPPQEFFRRQTDHWDLPLSSHPVNSTQQVRDLVSFGQSLVPRNRLSAINPSSHGSVALSMGMAEPIDLTRVTDGSDANHHSAKNTQSSSSESDSEIIRRTGRRIRGVLPASWLRLDQGRRKPVPVAQKRQSPNYSSVQRPGLAVRKAGPCKPAVSIRSFLEQLHEDEEDLDIEPGLANVLAEEHDRGDSNVDDGASVTEVDYVDLMLPAQIKNCIAGPSSKGTTQRTGSKNKSLKRYRQSSISSSVNHPARPDKSQRPHANIRSERSISPPALSIVDFVGSHAPRFLKIAARAARRRTDLGRSKPCNKNINLGNRTDNVDALSVLTAWKSGKINASKITHPSTGPDVPPPFFRRLLRPGSTRLRRQHNQRTSGLSFTQPQRMTRQVNVASLFVAKDSETSITRYRGLRTSQPCTRSANSTFRPALLETEVLDGHDVVFTPRDKILDLVRRENRREVLAPTFELKEFSTGHAAQGQPPDQQQSGDDRFTVKARRSRKPFSPNRVDLALPQFTQANDPVPFKDEPDVQEQWEASVFESNEIRGLGPQDTYYTSDFDVFPLPAGTFFHRTTLIGDGTLHKALHAEMPKSITFDRRTLSFVFSNHHFHWDKWDDSASSGVGLFFDLLTEKLCEGEAMETVTCADHVLEYLLDSTCITKEAELGPLTQRFAELLSAFMDQTQAAGRHSHALLQVNIRLLICSFLLLRLASGSFELATESQEMEDVLKRLARIVISHLFSIGLAEVRAVYDDLQRLAIRKQGIRNDSAAVVCWVITIKILESAHIPGASFWELTCSVLTKGVAHINHAQKLEGLWRSIFTLLPLGEVNDDGLLNEGMRFAFPLQGWALPQQLLRWVFDSYQPNKRQSPSFNNYCRALLARCHHLISTWGWNQAFGVVGTIFDFFGYHNLSHLRNEEAYKSPRFLEHLSSRPCLLVEREDRCFHIFLKILAMAIQHMGQKECHKQIQNLIARCLPNHNRRYSKEQIIHSHDLASLRNHHDLLCTLYWAAPSEDRRPLELIENLVQPASSHKEACLINLRAWGQLARFVVTHGGSIQDYRPFMSWQNNLFQQVLNQYLSADADVQHQFMSLAKEDRQDIPQQFLHSVAAANQAAAKEVLYFSVESSLDVLKHCPSLTSAVFSFNASQLSKVFDKLIHKDEDLDWRIIQTSFDTVDFFVERLEIVWKNLRQSSCDSIPTNSHEFEDAVDFLDEKVLASGFFRAVRQALRSKACDSIPQPGSPSLIVENVIVLCARIASIFVDGGKTQLRHFFSPGKYNLFEGLPNETLILAERRFLPLFIATLLRNHIFNFSSLGCDQFDLWISCLVVPFQASRYQNRLAETLKSMDKGFMEGATVSSAAIPNYETSRDWFSCGLLFMRRTLKMADLTQRKKLQSKYEKLLGSVMQRIKFDLKSFKLNSAEHKSYVSFVREIVGLVKSHGTEICAIDPFYYQVSAEYSPAEEDPKLHTASIHAYGIRLCEGDATAVPQLFSYLYTHLKSALASGQLDLERISLENGMTHGSILAFMIGHMMPAIIKASSRVPEVWPLLSVYSQAIRNILGRSCLPREISQDYINDVIGLLSAILDWLRTRALQAESLTPIQAHTLTELMRICNTIRPSISCWMLDPLFSPTEALQDCLDSITKVAKWLMASVDELRGPNGDGGILSGLSVSSLGNHLTKLNCCMQLDHYTRHFAQELINTPETITAKVAFPSSAMPGAQSTGVRNDFANGANGAGVVSEVLDGLRDWIDEVGKGHQHRRRRKRQKQGPYLLSCL